jgi:hypothetical protein
MVVFGGGKDRACSSMNEARETNQNHKSASSQQPAAGATCFPPSYCFDPAALPRSLAHQACLIRCVFAGWKDVLDEMMDDYSHYMMYDDRRQQQGYSPAGAWNGLETLTRGGVVHQGKLWKRGEAGAFGVPSSGRADPIPISPGMVQPTVGRYLYGTACLLVTALIAMARCSFGQGSVCPLLLVQLLSRNATFMVGRTRTLHHRRAHRNYRHEI